MKNNILWLRNDLRFQDNTALIKAVENSYTEGASLTLLFHINEDQIKSGTYSNDYFFSALNVFYKELKNIGGDLLFLYGKPDNAFNEFFEKNKNINRVFFNLSERGYGLERDEKVIEIFKKNNIQISSFFDKHLHSASEILNIEGNNYKVFTPYYKKWLSLSKNEILDFDKVKFKAVLNDDFTNEYKLEFDNILKSRKTNFENFCGEKKAFEELNSFIDERLIDYENKRDDVFADDNSDMSKYLSTGQISIRQVYHAISEENYSSGSECYLKQLGWRDFYNMVYHYNQGQEKKEIIEKYRSIKWNKDEYAFKIWKHGLTGYPIVDAAMRNLLNTGKMHNRLRMIAASFLVKDLLIDWRIGEQYFKETLIDYDSASNIGSWQWVASTGTDACPYFRIFNPTTQSKKFDKNGFYIKSILDELADLESKYIHEPHKSKAKDFDYPDPIVTHKDQRPKILDMYKSQNPYEYSTDMKNEFIKRYTLFDLSKIKNASKKDLIDFHSKNKYLYFTYSIDKKNKLGQILAQKGSYAKIYEEYKRVLNQVLGEKPTVKKTINAYDHMYGYFKEHLNSGEKDKYDKLILEYRANNNLDDSLLKIFFNEISKKYNIEYIKIQSLINDY